MMRKLWLGVMLTAGVLAGCSGIKQPGVPTGPEVVERLLSDESPQKTQRWLLIRGYKQLERNGYGGLWPRTGPCYQATKGFRLQDKTTTRVCFVRDRDPVVFVRNSLGQYWSELYPQDLSRNLNEPSGLGGISDETVELMKQ